MYLEKAIQTNPEYVGAYISMGNLCDRLHDREGVRKYFDKAMLLDPNNSTVLCNIGYRLYETGHQKDAVEHFNRALQSNLPGAYQHSRVCGRHRGRAI